MKTLISLFLFISLTALSYQHLSASSYALEAADANADEVLYLPKGKGLEFMSFGYRNVLSDILWFNTINYFGKHYTSDRNYEWLAHMCDLVTTLDPNAPAVTEFCSTMLAWEANKPEESVKLLSKAISNRPSDWNLRYLRGFSYMFFLKDAAKAKDDFVEAAKSPDAHLIVKRLAASALVSVDDPETAISFLYDMLKSAKDPNQAKALEEKLRDARYELDMRTLEKALQIYKNNNRKSAHSLEDLAAAGIVQTIPRDPFGGTYYLEAETGEVKSTSKKKRLSIYSNPQR